ncbi:unnamed protein product [Mortierella alpina]
MTAFDVSMKLAAAENQDRSASSGVRHGVGNDNSSSTTPVTSRRITRSRTDITTTTTTVTPCQRCHRHSPSISSASSSSEVVAAPPRNHRRRFSMQIAPVPLTPSSTSGSSNSGHSHRCRQYRQLETVQSSSTQVPQAHASRYGRGHSHHQNSNASGSSSSFLRRIIKVFVGNNHGGELHDCRHNRVHPLDAPIASRSPLPSSSGPRSSDLYRHSQEMEELQTDESGSCEECECSCEDPHIDNTKALIFRSSNTNTMNSHALPPPPCPSQSTSEFSRGHKKRSNSTVTTSSVASSTDGTGGRHIRSSRPGRISSVGGVSVNSCYTDSGESSSGVGSSDFVNRRSSMVSSTGGSFSGSSNGGAGDKALGHRKSQLYRQHFTGHGLFTPQYAAQQEAMAKRRLSFFKAVALGGVGLGAGSPSRRGSAFSTKSQETAVNLTGINIADEPEDEIDTEDECDSESLNDDDQDHNMDVDEDEDEESPFNDNDLNDPNDYNDSIYDQDDGHDEDAGAIEQDYYAHDSNSSMMLTSDVELELYRRRQEEEGRKRLSSRARRFRYLRRQGLLLATRHLKTNDSVEPVVYRTRSKASRHSLQLPLAKFEQRPSPIQLPEILHLIFQFVVDFTPADDFSQREIYSCLLVSKQWYLVAQKTLWREIRLKNPTKLEMLIDLLRRTDTVECLGIERNRKQPSQTALVDQPVPTTAIEDQQPKQSRSSAPRQQMEVTEMSITTKGGTFSTFWAKIPSCRRLLCKDAFTNGHMRSRRLYFTSSS